MSQRNIKIAVIGAGFAGIFSIYSLKEEGIDPICFEKTDQLGGTWCYREESIPGVGSTMPTTILNHSKEMGAISNFPPRKERSIYMRQSELYQCMEDFVEKNDLFRHVRFNSEVVSCRMAEDYEDTGRWTITVRNTLDGSETTDTYDRVSVCVGQFNRPKFPSFPGMEIFKGKVMHTHSLKDVSSFKGQNVVVVGMGISGLDAAVETSTVAKQVYLSTRSGSLVFTRVGPHGYPIDHTLLRRYIVQLLDYFPAWFLSWAFQKIYLDPVFDQKLFAVQPKNHLFAQTPVSNDNLHSKLLSGAVVQKGNISRFTEAGVIFESEDEVTEVNTVIMATGYEWKFPFLEEGVVVQEKDLKIHLFKCMWPSHMRHPTLSIIGLILPYGPGFPIGELQCRYMAQVFAGNIDLPSVDDMMKDINIRHAKNISRWTIDDKVNLKTDFVQYCDELASIIGVKPNLWKYLFTDFQLFWKLLFGPSVPYQYRLEGPHTWDGAREAIMTVEERLLFPLRKEKKEKIIHC